MHKFCVYALAENRGAKPRAINPTFRSSSSALSHPFFGRGFPYPNRLQIKGYPCSKLSNLEDLELATKANQPFTLWFPRFGPVSEKVNLLSPGATRASQSFGAIQCWSLAPTKASQKSRNQIREKQGKTTNTTKATAKAAALRKLQAIRKLNVKPKPTQ